MKQIIDYFDHAYVVNLSDRTDRRRQIEKEFRRVGVELPGEKVEFFTATRPADKGNFHDIGTRGCFNSHRSILELAYQKRLRNVLIFEDDVSFRDVGADFEHQVIGELAKNDWDIVFFGYAQPNDEALKGPLLRWPKEIMGTHFYGLNGKSISTILQYMNECELRPRDHPDGGPMPMDGVYNHIRYIKPNINLFISAPSLGYQRSSRTDVAQMHFFDKIVWLRPLLDRLRALKHQLRAASDKNKMRRKIHSD